MKPETSTTFTEVAALEDRYQLATYKKMPIVAERGEGVWMYASRRRRSIWISMGAMRLPARDIRIRTWWRRLQRAGGQAACSIQTWFTSGARARAAEKLVSIAPDRLTKVFFCNSGTEANENAMRMARMATGRENVITFSGGFHGRTADAISATFLGKYRELGKPNVPGHLEAKFGDIESVRALADENVAAIMLEPIQSMAGVKTAEPEFFVDPAQVVRRARHRFDLRRSADWCGPNGGMVFCR